MIIVEKADSFLLVDLLRLRKSCERISIKEYGVEILMKDLGCAEREGCGEEEKERSDFAG
jgi:hypothetical protein